MVNIYDGKGYGLTHSLKLLLCNGIANHNIFILSLKAATVLYINILALLKLINIFFQIELDLVFATLCA